MRVGSICVVVSVSVSSDGASIASGPSSQLVTALDEIPTAGWLLVWALGAAGECACPRRYGCPRPGKHPWAVRSGGDDVIGFPHGALSAVDTLAAASGMLCGGNRLAVVPGDQIVVLDLDGDRAWRTFVRYMAGEIPGNQFLGAARTPRGWHVYVGMAAGGWDAGSCAAWLKNWLGPGMGGVEIRCGSRSYVVWPSGLDGRRWVSGEEFAARVARAFVAIPAYGVVSAWGPPWLQTDEATPSGMALAAWQASKVGAGGGGGRYDNGIKVADLEWQTASARLTAACKRLAGITEGNRNNALNIAAFFQGAEA